MVFAGVSDMTMSEQRAVFDEIYANLGSWDFHDTPDPLVRYLRDRRLSLAFEMLSRLIKVDRLTMTTLVVCGGVGGEATWLLNNGFGSVVVSDVSPAALSICSQREPRADVVEIDAQAMLLDDDSFDLVVVQDGLHHLTNPVLGFTEMLRVARRAVVVIEPHDSLAGRVLGKRWEEHEGGRNFVFRWSARLVEQATRAWLLDDQAHVSVRRLWDHNVVVGRLARVAGGGPGGLRVAHAIYAGLRPFDRVGNMMVAVVALSA